MMLTELQAVLSSGGDSRSLYDDSGRNSYNVPLFPISGSAVLRSSSTCSPLTQEGLERVSQLFTQISAAGNGTTVAEDLLEGHCKSIRERICRIFCPDLTLGEDVVVVCTPSGTDAEMILSFLALLQNPKWSSSHAGHEEESVGRSCDLTTNIVVAGGEVGSGTALACGLKVFNPTTPSGKSEMTKGSSIEGVPNGSVHVVEFPARDGTSGHLVSSEQLESEIGALLERVVGQKEEVGEEGEEEENENENENESTSSVVVVHAVHASKTGFPALSPDFLKRMKVKYGSAIIGVVDAAQTRCDDGVVQEWVQSGLHVIVSGSKFFAGPPFSGAILMPMSDRVVVGPSRCSSLMFPAGLNDYFTRHEMGSRLEFLKEHLSDRRNLGLLLRWEAALCEIESFFEVPRELRNAIAQFWVSGVESLIQSLDFVRSLQSFGDEFVDQTKSRLVGEVNTIVSFAVFVSNTDEEGGEEGEKMMKMLQVPDLRKVHLLMARDDIGSMLSDDNGADDEGGVSSCAGRICLLGQPVKISEEIAVLRVAMSAPLITQVAGTEASFNDSVKARLDEVLEGDKNLFKKLAIVLKQRLYLL